MLEDLKVILEIQEFDMKMLRLMRLKQERKKEISHIWSLRKDLETQLSDKKKEIFQLSQQITEDEATIESAKERILKLEEQQSIVKKVEEFNTITREMNDAERKRSQAEQSASDLIDKKNMEEEILNKIQESLEASAKSSKALEDEILQGVKLINAEGKELQDRRNALAKTANADFLVIYDKLLKNKKDRVIVPLENRNCSGCHISLTAQHENMVRKGERLIFCEHCSRIHYWEEDRTAPEGAAAPTKRRRRRTVAAT